jgi:hypothetical protein
MAIPGIYARYDLSDTLSYPGTGTTLFDLSNNNDCEITGTVTFAGTGQSKYLQFTPAGEEAVTINNVVTSGVELTVNMWLKVTAFNSGFDCVFTFGPGYPGTYLYIWCNYGSQQKYYVEMSDSTPINTGISPSANFDNIIVSVESSTITVFVNGVNAGSQSHTLTSWPANTKLYINAADTQGPSRSSSIEFPYLEAFETGLGSTAAIALYNSQLNRFVPPPPPPVYVGRVRGRQFNQGLNG